MNTTLKHSLACLWLCCQSCQTKYFTSRRGRNFQISNALWKLVVWFFVKKMVNLNSGRKYLYVKLPGRETFKNWCTLICMNTLQTIGKLSKQFECIFWAIGIWVVRLSSIQLYVVCPSTAHIFTSSAIWYPLSNSAKHLVHSKQLQCIF